MPRGGDQTRDGILQARPGLRRHQGTHGLLRLCQRVRRLPQPDPDLPYDQQVQGKRPARDADLFEDDQDPEKGKEGENRGRMETGKDQPGRGGESEGSRTSSRRRTATQEKAGKAKKTGSIVYRAGKVLLNQ